MSKMDRWTQSQRSPVPELSNVLTNYLLPVGQKYANTKQG